MNLLALLLVVTPLIPASHAQEIRSDQQLLPPIAVVQERALAHARLDLDEIVSWKRKSRMAAFIPRLQVDYGYRTSNDVDVRVEDNVYVGASGITVGPEDGRYTNGFSADHSIGVRAVWELHEALFNPKALAVSAEARNVLRARTALLQEIAHQYYQVATVHEAMASLSRMAEQSRQPEKIRHQIFLRRVECQESAAKLDAMTGHWLSDHLQGLEGLCQSDPTASGRR